MCDVPVRFADILVIVIDEVSMISVYTGIGGVTRFKLKLQSFTPNNKEAHSWTQNDPSGQNKCYDDGLCGKKNEQQFGG